MRNIVASAFSRNSPFAQNAKMMGVGFVEFLKLKTGFADATHPWTNYVVNDVGVIANTLTGTDMGNGWTDHTAVSLDQMELMQGAFAMWKATGEPRYYTLFMQTLTAYRTYFYAGQPVPPFAQIWRANYIVNAREPFTLNGQTVARNQPYDPLPPGGGTVVTDPALMGNYTFADLSLAELLSQAFSFTAERDFQAMFNSVVYTAFDFLANMEQGNAGVSLPYVPGAAPGTIGMTPRLFRKDSWSGMCFLAMQYPSAMATAGRADEMINVINLYTDSQDAYLSAKAIDGPFYTTYLWDRPGNPDPGGFPWANSGLNNDNARAFLNMARLMLTLHERNGTPIPEPERICTRHAEWLYAYVQANNELPTFNDPMDPINATAPGIYGPTAALYLTGLVFMARAGYDTPEMQTLRTFCFNKLSSFYAITRSPVDMSGAFTPDAANRNFTSAHGGMALRALGEFISWETRNDPAVVRPVGLARVMLENESGFVRVETADGVVLKEESQAEE